MQGFLPESGDEFVRTWVYTAFSPTVIIFLLCSTTYGIWKTYSDPDSLKDTF